MSPHSSRPVVARALAVLLTVLLAVTGLAAPAFADDVVGTPAPVETSAPSSDPAPEATEPAVDRTVLEPEVVGETPTETAAETAPAEPETEVVTGKASVTAAAAVAPALVVSKMTGLDASGETVTVTGSGYNPAQPMYLIVCRDVPLTDVTFAFASGCVGGAKQITANPTTATMVKLEADGSFTTSFTVSRNAAFTTGAAIYTVANHTAMNDRTQDAKQAIAFTPLLTVTPATGLSPAGQTVTVTGSGYNPAQPMYLIYCRDVPVSTVTFTFAAGCTSGSKQVTANPTTATMVKLEADGTFTTTFTIAANPAFTTGGAIYTVANHTAMGDRTQDARRVVAFAPATATTTVISAPASAVAGSDVAVEVTVSPAAAGSVVLSGAGGAQTSAVDGTGTATFTLSALAAATYSLSAAFTPTNALVYAASSGTASLLVTAPAPVPTIVVSKTTSLDASGETVTVTGSGYNPAQPMYLIVCRDVPLSSVTFAFAAGCTSGSKQITANPTTATMVKLEADGTFTTTFTVAKNPAFTTGTAIYTVANHTAMNDRSQDAKQAIAFTPLLTVTPATALDPAGQTVTVTGSGYNPAQPMYLIYCRQAPLSTVNFAFAAACTSGSKQVTANPTTATMVKLEADGTFTTTFTIAANPAFTTGGAIYTVANHTAMGDRTQDARRLVAFASAATTTTVISAPARIPAAGSATVEVTVTPVTAGSVELTGAGDPRIATVDGSGTATFVLDGLPSGTYALTAVFTPTNPLVRAGSTGSASLEVAAAITQVGALSWGFKADFRAYVVGDIAHGSITTTGVSTSGGIFGFTQVGGSLDDAGLGSASYGGSVRFTGHNGALDLRLADPIVRLDSAASGTLLVRVNGGSHVAFANLALGSGTRSVVNGVIGYAGVPATLTAAGSAAFDNRYPVGEPLDAVTFTVGAAGTASGTTRTVAAYVAPANTPDATPPATEGVTSEESEFTEGATATFTADGFQPNETGILAVIYSEPTVLADDLTADAAGAITWTGTLPAGLTGEHTFTFQGSVDRGIVIEIAEAEVVGCPVAGAELDWGFKESFRAYIDGSIANGEWTTADGATYETPLFGFTGTGGYDAGTGDADLAFTGSVRFTGHGGALDTTIANPRVVIDGDRAVLLLDISGTTQSGETVAQTGVEFAELDLAAAELGGGGDLVAFTGIPATLTAAGAAAFGTYPAGEALDPIDLRITVDPACVEPVAVVEETTPVATENVSAASPLPWILGALALLLVAAAVAFLVRRNRTA